MSAARRPSGFSLVELLVALVVAGIVVAGALTLLVSQQRTFQGGASDRALQEAGRVSLERLVTELRTASYGMDPGLAFDFGAAQAIMDRAALPEGTTTIPFGGHACNAPVTCRDRTDGPDEIVFHSRNPDFGRLVLAASPSELSLEGPLNTPLRAGQILQVACYSGELTWAYVTVGSEVAATADAVVAVPLRDAVAEHAFGSQNKYLEGSCFAGEARAFKIDRFRFYVETYDPAGAVQPWGTAGARPYLMLDQGLVNAAGAPILDVIAPDVEDLQLAYVFPLAPPATRVRGATAGTPLQADAAGIDLAPATVPPMPLYSTPKLDVVRTTGHPSNLRAVRVGVVIRQAEATPGLSDPVLPALSNRDAIARESNRRRVVFETTVAVPNMESRGPVFPTYGAAGDPADAPLNHGGG